MNEDRVAGEIRALVAKIIKLPADKINPKDNLFTDLGVDSLLGVEIFAALDKKYYIDIPEEKLKKVKTLGDLVQLVNNLI